MHDLTKVDPTAPQTFTATSGELVKNFTLHPGCTVKGRFVLPAEVTGEVTIERYRAYRYNVNGYERWEHHDYEDTVTLAADGSFTFTQGAFEGRRYSFDVWISGGPSGWPGGGKDSPEALTVEAGPNGIDFGTQDIVPNSTPKVPVEMLRLEGVPAVGSTLRLVTPDGRVGAPAAVPGATVEYRWFRDGVRITGAPCRPPRPCRSLSRSA